MERKHPQDGRKIKDISFDKLICTILSFSFHRLNHFLVMLSNFLLNGLVLNFE